MSAEHVTRAELAAHLEPMKEDVREVKAVQKELRSEMNAGFKEIADSQWLGPQGRSFIAAGSLLGALVSLAIGLLALFHG